MIQEFLKEIGLSEKEIQIYVFLLKVDSAGVADIHLKTSVNRTTVYPVLKDLIEKGFVEEVEVKGKTQYRARTPDYIETYLQEQKIKLEEQTARAKSIIPQMKGYMREDGEKPIIEYYPDREGIINSFRSMYQLEDIDEKTAYLIYPRDLVTEKFTKVELEKVFKLRQNNNINIKSIYSTSDIQLKNEIDGIRHHISSKEFDIKSDITVYGDRVRIQMLGDHLGSLMIKSKDVADTLIVLFKLAMKGLDSSKK